MIGKLLADFQIQIRGGEARIGFIFMAYVVSANGEAMLPHSWMQGKLNCCALHNFFK